MKTTTHYRTYRVLFCLICTIYICISSFTVNAQTYDFSDSIRWKHFFSIDTIPIDIPLDSIIRAEGTITQRTSHEELSSDTSNIQRISLLSVSTETHSHIPISVSVNTSKDVGEIPYTTGVSPAGGVTYSIPIHVAPGRGDLQPNISINYNSNGGNSVLGYGWSIGGLSSIMSVPKNIYYNGDAAPSAYSEGSAYTLDGIRLLPVSGYTYEPEHGNMRIKRPDNANYSYFTVEYPNGVKGIYGYNSSAGDLESPLTRLTDPLGNYMEFTYEKSNGKYYITKIEYGRHTSLTATLASIEFTYKPRTDINSWYELDEVKLDRLLDKIVCKNGTTLLHTYTFTYQTDKVSLLTKIDCDNLNPLQFYYGYSDNTAALSQQNIALNGCFSTNQVVTLKGKFDCWSDNDALIVYPDKSPFLFDGQKYISGFSPDQSLLVYQNLTSGPVLPSSLTAGAGFQTLLSADVDGVPGEEVIHIGNILNSSNDQITVKVYKPNLYTSLSLQYTRTYTTGSAVSANNTKSIWPKLYYTGNFTGNGKMELLAVSMHRPLNQNQDSKCYLYDLDNNQLLFNNHVFNFDISNNVIIPLDIDGDGKTDIAHIHAAGITFYSFKKIGNLMYNLVNIGLYTGLKMSDLAGKRLMLGDINGDGKTDIILTPPLSSYYTSTVYRSVATWHQCPSCGASDATGPECGMCGDKIGHSPDCYGCGAPLNNQSCPYHGTDYPMETTLYNDGGNQWKIYLAKNTTFVLKTQNIVKVEYTDRVVLQDVDQDGIVDLVHFRQDNQTELYVYFTRNGILNAFPSEIRSITLPVDTKLIPSTIISGNYHSFVLGLKGSSLRKIRFEKNEFKQRLLTGFVSSLGVVHRNYYDRLNSTSDDIDVFYTHGNNAVFPYINFRGPLWVATAQDLYVGGSEKGSLRYLYENSILHKQGLGFCGFTKITTNDVKRNRTVSSTHNPMQFGIKTGEVTPVSQSTYNYSVAVAANKKATIRKTSETATDLLKGVTVTASYTYNSYNNPLTETITYTDTGTTNVIKTTTTYTYNDLATTQGYLIGRPASKTIVNSRDGSTWTTSETFTYNGNTMLPATRISKVGTGKSGETRWTYDAYGNLLTEKSAPFSATEFLGNTYTYDSNNRYLLTKTDALGRVTSYASYNKFGNPGSVTDYRQKVTGYAYDNNGRITTVTYPKLSTETALVETTSYAWNSGTGLYVITESSTGGTQVKTFYDALKREVRTGNLRIDDTWQYVDKQYDSYGRNYRTSLPFKGTSASLWNTYTYDSYDRVTRLTEASGKLTTYSYSNNSVTTVADGVSTTRTNDKSGLLKTVTDPAGTITYTYYPHGQLKSVTAPGSVVTTFEYDNFGRQTKLVDPSAGAQTYNQSYSGRIRTEKQIDARGKTTTAVYDTYGRITSLSNPDLTTSYTYDPTYKVLTKESSGNGTSREYTYDALGRVSAEKETGPENVWLKRTFTYNAGNVTSVAYSNSRGTLTTQQENMTYKNGHLQEIKLGTTSVWKLTAENAFGQPTSSTIGSLTRTYGYTTYGLPSSRIVNKSTTNIQNYTYSFDVSKGNLTWRKDNYGTRAKQEDFTYDSMNRLKTFNSRTAAYDVKGNITSLTSVGSTFGYDSSRPYAISSITSPTTSIPTVTQSITYNAQQRPVTISESTYTATFTYNSSGDRMKMVQKNGTTTELTRYYIGNYEYDSGTAGTKERLYIGGDAYSAPAVYVKDGTGAWAIQYICRDYLGSITHVTNASGTLLQELSYDAWGRLRNPANQTLYTAANQPTLLLGRGYTGHEHLTKFGLINMNARLYDPVLGRFLSPDPYVQMPDFSQNFNRYSYCLNNPLRYTDPSGELFLIDDLIIGAVIGAYLNVVVQGMTGNINNVGDMFKAAGVGAISGFAGGAMGQFVSSNIMIGGFWGGFVSGSTSGAVSGFTLGAGNIWANGGGFESGLRGGLIGGGIGFTTGGVLSGISSGIASMTRNGNFFTGKGEILADYMTTDFSGKKIEIGEGLTYSTEFAKEFSLEKFPDAVGVDNLYADGRLAKGLTREGDLVKHKGTYVRGVTVRNGIGKGSDVYLYKAAFICKEQLYLTMGHEYIHAGFYSLGLTNESQHHAFIRNWEYGKAVELNYNIGYYNYLRNRSYISPEYKKAGKLFNY